MGFEKRSGLQVWDVCAQGNDTKPWGPCILTGSLRAGLEALEDPHCDVRAWVPVQRPSSILSDSYSNPSPVSQPSPSTCQLTTPALVFLLPFHLRGTGKPLHLSASGGNSSLFRDRVHQSFLSTDRQTASIGHSSPQTDSRCLTGSAQAKLSPGSLP